MSTFLETKPSISKSSALLALMILAPLPTLGVWFAAFGNSSSIGQVIWAVAKVGIFVGPVLWWRFVQGQQIRIPALRSTGMLVGLFSAVVLASTIFASYWWIARSTLDFLPLKNMLSQLGLTSLKQYLALVIYLTLVNSLIEEYVFRWFFYQQLKRLMNPSIAVFASACIFTLHHTVVLTAYVPWYFNAAASFGVFSGGLIWSFLYYRYKNIWPAYVSHIGADVGVFLIGYHMLFVAG